MNRREFGDTLSGGEEYSFDLLTRTFRLRVEVLDEDGRVRLIEVRAIRDREDAYD